MNRFAAGIVMKSPEWSEVKRNEMRTCNGYPPAQNINLEVRNNKLEVWIVGRVIFKLIHSKYK